jgi:NAD(P)-dependent dehydrogenase (short-subunit alcohol dehydrogenase family)
MGRSIALTLAREGACVAINYRGSREHALEIANQMRERGGQAQTMWRKPHGRKPGCSPNRRPGNGA